MQIAEKLLGLLYTQDKLLVHVPLLIIYLTMCFACNFHLGYNIYSLWGDFKLFSAL